MRMEIKKFLSWATRLFSEILFDVCNLFLIWPGHGLCYQKVVFKQHWASFLNGHVCIGFPRSTFKCSREEVVWHHSNTIRYAERSRGNFNTAIQVVHKAVMSLSMSEQTVTLSQTEACYTRTTDSEQQLSFLPKSLSYLKKHFLSCLLTCWTNHQTHTEQRKVLPAMQWMWAWLNFLL